jgi:hypothetical protein
MSLVTMADAVLQGMMTEKQRECFPKFIANSYERWKISQTRGKISK